MTASPQISEILLWCGHEAFTGGSQSAQVKELNAPQKMEQHCPELKVDPEGVG